MEYSNYWKYLEWLGCKYQTVLVTLKIDISELNSIGHGQNNKSVASEWKS